MPTSTSRLPVRPHWLLLGVAVLAAAIVALAATASSNSSPSATSGGSSPAVSGAAATKFQGIPEHNGVLGASTAKLTLTEFVDPQCPICAAAARQDLPTLVGDYVRTGKIKLRAQVLQFIGPESVTAARFAAGAAQQQRLWPFLATLYSAQGQENSGYMTPAFLRSVAKASGVDAAKAGTYATTA